MCPVLSRSEALKLIGDARWEAFCKYARHYPTSPDAPYVIKIGSKTLFSNDTYDLREQFYRHLKSLKLRRKRQRSQVPF